MLSDIEMSLYEIAFHLKMPIYKLLDEMSYDELLGWFDYFSRRPVGWRADDRAYKLLQAQGVKEKPTKLFSSLIPIYKPKRDKDSAVASLPGSIMLNKLLTAKGGHTLKLDDQG